MLQFIRSKAGSFFVKILFVLLIGSFGIWGIGDFLRQRPQDTAIITVGSTKIRGDEIDREVRQQLDRMRQSTGSSLTIAQAKQFGLIDNVVETMINRALMDQAAESEHIVISDRQLVDAMEQEKAFQGPDGKFDRNTFQSLLRENRLTEAQYAGLKRTDLPRILVSKPAVDLESVPTVLTDFIYKIKNEQRTADWVYLPNASAKDLPSPDDAALKDYYDKHKDVFTAPELRAFTLLPMVASDVAGEIKITDDQLKDSYQQRLEEFTKPEKRHVMQMLLPDEKTAYAATAALASGKDFAQVAKDIAKQDPSTVDLGTVTKKDLPPGSADLAFAAKEGEITKPSQTLFGWVIVKVSGIEPGGVKSFDEAKGTVEKDLRKDAESEALYKLSNKVQDAISAGADLSQIAEQFKLKPVNVAAMDDEGNGPDAKPVSGLPIPVQTLLQTVNETPKDQVSTVAEAPGGIGFYAVKVTGITPAALKPFDQVKDQVKEAWLADQRKVKIEAQAKSLLDAVKPDTGLGKAAAAQKLQVSTSPAFTRENRNNDVKLPPTLIAQLFHLKVGEAATDDGPAGTYVAQLKTIQAADPATDKTGPERQADELKNDLNGELLAQFEAALRNRYKVEIKQAALDALFQTGQP
jgi:peptidyl-prolyl cis-trans isomerase D